MNRRKVSGILGIVAGIGFGIYAAGNIEQSGIAVMTVAAQAIVDTTYENRQNRDDTKKREDGHADGRPSSR